MTKIAQWPGKKRNERVQKQLKRGIGSGTIAAADRQLELMTTGRNETR